ncbi:MAG: hypothetical protein LBM92_04305, partial [Opitutaceae bacterium]|nr:hypothetical protein [Opitutaceae bacterium]
MKKEMLIAAALLAAPFSTDAQVPYTGGAYTQDFNTLPRAGGRNTWENNKTLPGWHADFMTRENLPFFRADSGGGSVGVASYGSDGSADRALGSRVSANSGDMALGFCLRNDTGATITSVTISYDGEQWREDGETPATLFFACKVNGGLRTGTGGWTPVEKLNFTGPKTAATARPIDGK